MAKNSMDMTSGNLFKKIILYSIPIILTSVLQLLYNACDLMIVGKFAENGTEALAAVGGTGALINLVISLFIGLSIGASVSYARSVGQKDYDRANRAVHTAVIVSLVASIFITIVGILSAKTLLRWMKSPDDVIDLSTLYVQIYFGGTVFNLLYNFTSSLVRANGDTKRPLYILTASGLSNIVFNLIFVLVFKMSVEGVAIATVISQAISAIAMMAILIKEDGPLNFSFKKLSFDKEIFKEMVVIGLPSGIQSSLFSISNMTIQSAVNSFNNVAIISGNTAAGNLEGFVYVSMNSIHQATLNFTGQNYGAKKYDNIKKTLIYSLLLVLFVGELTGILFFVLGPWLLQLYTNEPVVIDYALNRMQFVCAIYGLCGLMDILVGSLRGLGYSLIPMVVSIVGICAYRVLWVKFVFNNKPTLTILYISYPISWIITALALGVCILHVFNKVKKKFNIENNNEFIME
jgi:putative MATE family efflux protein